MPGIAIENLETLNRKLEKTLRVIQELREEKISLEVTYGNMSQRTIAYDKNDIDKEKPLICGYGSGTWKPNESNYHINDKELLAIKFGIKRFHYHLLPLKFVVRTDNTQVRSFITNRIDPLPEFNRRRKWKSFFNCYDFIIKNIAGNKNVFADFLSRYHGN